ncbi:MAG TPA: ABC transporter, partial [Rhodospirillaceae bacterium]|nr:ABC transporter [Rhodospirillaceae bacterium]
MKILRRTLGFLKPYKKQVFYALTALAITAGSVLALGQGLRVLIDGGFSSGDPDALNKSLLALLGLSIVMAVGGYFRFYMVTWLGERVV